MSKPFKVHELLSAAELGELEGFAREPGRTIDECHEWLQAHGFTLSRGAVGNWLGDFKAQIMREKFSRSAELAAQLKSAVSNGEFSNVADAAVMQLVQHVFEQTAQLDGADADTVVKMTQSLRNLVGSKERLTAMLAEKFDKEMASKTAAKKTITAEDIAEARKAIFGL